MTLPWLIRAIVASAGIFFSGNLHFLFISTFLEKLVVSFMHAVVRSGLLGLWFIRFMHGTMGNDSLKLRVIKFMHGILGSFAHWRK